MPRHLTALVLLLALVALAGAGWWFARGAPEEVEPQPGPRGITATELQGRLAAGVPAQGPELEALIADAQAWIAAGEEGWSLELVEGLLEAFALARDSAAVDAEARLRFEASDTYLAAQDLAQVERVLRAHVDRMAPSRYGGALMVNLAEVHRYRSEYREAIALLERAEAHESDEAMRGYTRLIALETRLKLDLALGLADRALERLERLAQMGGALEAELDGLWIDLLAGRHGKLVSAADALLAGEVAPGVGDRVRLLRARARASLGQDLTAARTDLEALERSAELGAMERGLVQLSLAELELAEARPGEAHARLQALWETQPSFSPMSAAIASAVQHRAAREAGLPNEAAEERLLTNAETFLALWKDVPDLPAGVGFLNSSHRRLIVGEVLSAQLARGDAGVRPAFEWVLRMQGKGSLARRSGADARRLGDVQAILRADEGLLVYVPGPRATHLFIVTRSGLEHLPLKPEGELIEALIAAWPGFAGSDPARATELLMPEAVAAHLRRWGRVSFSGTELLGATPMEVLEPTGVGPLGLARPTCTWPSMPMAVHLAERGPHSGGLDVLGVGVPDLSRSKLPPLETSEAEFAELFEAFGASEKVVLTGERATAAALLELARSGADRLVAFTHGMQDLERGRTAVLDFAGGSLGAEDLERSFDEAHPAPEVAFLAACGTSRGRLRSGEDGAQHLGGVLLARGSRCVILSRADLPERRTRELLGAWLVAHRGGASPAQALFEARRALAASGAGPHEWSLLHAYGLGH